MEYLKKLYDYNLWANKRVENSVLSQIDIIDQKIISLISHIAQTQIIWLNRIINKLPQINPWPDYNLETAFTVMMKGNTDWIDFINKTEPNKMYEICNYINTKGESFSNPNFDIAVHLVNHNSYHRGQIASMIRQNGGVPPVTDYIVFIRE